MLFKKERKQYIFRERSTEFQNANFLTPKHPQKGREYSLVALCRKAYVFPLNNLWLNLLL